MVLLVQISHWICEQSVEVRVPQVSKQLFAVPMHMVQKRTSRWQVWLLRVKFIESVQRASGLFGRRAPSATNHAAHTGAAGGPGYCPGKHHEVHWRTVCRLSKMPKNVRKKCVEVEERFTPHERVQRRITEQIIEIVEVPAPQVAEQLSCVYRLCQCIRI